VLGDLIGKTTSRSVSVGRKVADARRYLAACHVGGWSDLTMISHDSWSIRLLFAAESSAPNAVFIRSPLVVLRELDRLTRTKKPLTSGSEDLVHMGISDPIFKNI
jgi:hypothetical protein